MKSEYNISQLPRWPPSCNCSCSCLWGSNEWLRASTLQYRGGVSREAKQPWSREGKGPLPCILLCESQQEAAAICTPRCFLYVICNVKLAAAGVIQAFFSPVVIQRGLPLFESSSSPFIACVDCGATPKAESEMICAPSTAIFYKGCSMHSVWCFAGNWGNTELIAAQKTTSLDRTQPSKLLEQSLFQHIFQPNYLYFIVGKRRNLVKNTLGIIMAHVPQLALVNHFKETFSEDRRLSGGRPACQRQCLECFVCPFAHPALVPTKLQSSVALHCITLYLLSFWNAFFLYTLFKFWPYIICLTTQHL